MGGLMRHCNARNVKQRDQASRVFGWLSLIAVLSCCVAVTPAAVNAAGEKPAAEHWAFRHIKRPAVPRVRHGEIVRTPVDAFVLSELEKKNLQLGPQTDRATLLRRLAFDLTGLPPRPVEIEQFVADRSPDTVTRLIDRLLASPHYGERWGKYWLDVAGYADSNGYFNADTDRPLAYRYRDYVIRAFNSDKPFDQFVCEQLAGDELSGYRPGDPVTPRVVELHTATHFLRNAQDGTGESDGNPEELRVDRATALQGTLQITMNSLLGITIQCARCHEHKFEPIPHADYYRLQSVFYPAFPAYHPEQWIKPKNRVREMATGNEVATWEAQKKQLEAAKDEAHRNFVAWVANHRPASAVLFRDEFQTPGRLKDHWSSLATGGATPANSPSVVLDSATSPGALADKGVLKILESGGAGDRWLATKDVFDWTPDREGDWIQATFDLVADRVNGGPAERIGYFIALQNGTANTKVRGGNLLFDGNPAGGAAVHLGYPGDDSKILGEIGDSGYRAGHNYGVRVTNVGGGKCRLEHVVDLVPEKKAITLDAANLPNGSFGFEYCCGRSFVVDQVLVETSGTAKNPDAGSYRELYARQQKRFRKTLTDLEESRQSKPGNLASVSDLMANPAPLHILKRGSYTDLGEAVVPAGLSVLCDGPSALSTGSPFTGSTSTGRRTAFARWLTRPDSRASSLMARVMVNRIWQRHFGAGIVTTPDNFGVSGTPPTNAALLNYLADEFRKSGWSVKAVHRLILLSATYQQASEPRPEGLAADATDRLLWRYPLQRLDAEAVRDAMLTVSGEINERLYGPYVPTIRQEDGNVVVKENQEGVHRRALYLQQRRTQVNTFLELFDAPVIVNNCAVRGCSTVPLQSLALLNSDFVRGRAEAFAALGRNSAGAGHGAAPQAVRNMICASFGRLPTSAEQAASVAFLNSQSALYAHQQKAASRAWDDLCQMLLASNAFLYVE
jgi:hypothetical protein